MITNLYCIENRKGIQSFYFYKHKLSLTEYNELLTILMENTNELYAAKNTRYGITTTFYMSTNNLYKYKDEKNTNIIKIK